MIYSLLKESVLVLFISNIANFLRFVLQILIARFLITEAFGIYSSAYAVVNIFSVVAGAIISFITQILLQCSCENNDQRMALLIKSQRYCWYGAILLIALSPIFSYLLSCYLSFPSLWPGLIAFIANGLVLVVSYYSGVLLADLCFCENAIKELVISSLHIAATMLLVIVCSYSYNGAMSALLVAEIAGIVYLLRLIKPWNWQIPDKDNNFIFKDLFKYFLPLLIMWIVISLFLGVDVILARRYLSEEDAGVYAAASLIAKISFFVVSSLSGILFPTVCHNVRKGQSSAREVFTLMLIVALISCSMSLLFSIVPEFIMTGLFGQAYSGGAKILVWSSWFIAFFTINTVFFNYYAARKKIIATVIGAIGILISVAAILYIQPTSGTYIARSFFCGSIFVFSCCSIITLRTFLLQLQQGNLEVKIPEII